VSYNCYYATQLSFIDLLLIGATLGFQWEANTKFGIDTSQIVLPIASIGPDDFDAIYSLVVNQTKCSIYGVAPNEWVHLEGPLLTATSIIFTILFLICIIYAFYLLFDFWRNSHLEINIATSCIVLEIIGNILRIALVLDNPLTLKYGLGDVVIVTLHLPFSIVCGLLMVFFWQDALHKSIKIHQFLAKKFLYVAVVLSVIVIIIEVSVDIYKSVYPGGDANILLWIIMFDIYTVLFAILAILYCFTCIKALIQLKGLGLLEKSKKEFIKLTVKVLLSGIGMIITAVAYSLINALQTPALFASSLWLMYIGLFVQTFPELLLFGTSQNPAADNLGTTKDASGTPTVTAQ